MASRRASGLVTLAAVVVVVTMSVTPSLAVPVPPPENTGLCPEGWTIIRIEDVEDPKLRTRAERLDQIPGISVARGVLDLEFAGVDDGWTCIKFLKSGKIQVKNNNIPIR